MYCVNDYNYDLYDVYSEEREEQTLAKKALKHMEVIDEQLQYIINILYAQSGDVSAIDLDNAIGEMYDGLADFIIMSKKMPANLPAIVRK